jgi:hypothetical protein
MKKLLVIALLTSSLTLAFAGEKEKRKPSSTASTPSSSCGKISGILLGVSGGLQIKLEEGWLVLLTPKSSCDNIQNMDPVDCYTEDQINRVHQLAVVAFDKGQKFCIGKDLNGIHENVFSVGYNPYIK